MVELTDKEIEAIGNRRYLNEKGRYWKVWLALFGFMAVDGIFAVMTEHIWSKWAQVPVMAIIAFIGLGIFYKVVGIDSVKAGKKFREEWENERQK